MKRERIRRLIPHDGAMCLLDGVSHWNADGIDCHSVSHRDADNPLRRDGRLSAVNLVEYAAQAAALHHGLMQQAEGAEADRAGGALAAVRDLELAADELDTIADPLQIHARAVLRSPAGLIYRFTVRAGETQLAVGQLTIAIAADQTG